MSRIADAHGKMSDPRQVANTVQGKQAIRGRLWSALEATHVVKPGVAGNIPDFQGADQAAGRLAALPVLEQARPQDRPRPGTTADTDLGPGAWQARLMAAPKLATP